MVYNSSRRCVGDVGHHRRRRPTMCSSSVSNAHAALSASISKSSVRRNACSYFEFSSTVVSFSEGHLSKLGANTMARFCTFIKVCFITSGSINSYVRGRLHCYYISFPNLMLSLLLKLTCKKLSMYRTIRLFKHGSEFIISIALSGSSAASMQLS